MLSVQVAPTHLRGALGSVTQIGICSGILVAQVVNLLLAVEQWRSMMMLAAVPAVILILGMGLICPESPRYLASKGKTAEAKKSAEWLWGPGAGDGPLVGAAPDVLRPGEHIVHPGSCHSRGLIAHSH